MNEYGDVERILFVWRNNLFIYLLSCPLWRTYSKTVNSKLNANKWEKHSYLWTAGMKKIDMSTAFQVKFNLHKVATVWLVLKNIYISIYVTAVPYCNILQSHRQFVIFIPQHDILSLQLVHFLQKRNSLFITTFQFQNLLAK